MYIYENKSWPDFTWEDVSPVLLTDVRHVQGRLLGRMESLGFSSRAEATLQTLTQDVVKTSEIEGEKLDGEQVRSSIAKRMGLDAGALLPIDRKVEGIVDVMMDATRNAEQPLTEVRLFSWHTSLFPKGTSGAHPIAVGKWRTEASGKMQFVSGAYGHEKVHFEAPSHERLKAEMGKFLKWFNAPATTDLVLKSALAHFWFVTVHPFEDGNGRIARAIGDMVLARSERTSQRFYSMSSQIRTERKGYYEVLKRCQKGTCNISAWIDWYLKCMSHAISSADLTLQSVLVKSRFWNAHAGDSLNERQRAVINRLLDNFEGKLTTSKWAKLAKCSQDTALRDITELVGRNILTRDGAGGRSTRYSLRLPTA